MDSSSNFRDTKKLRKILHEEIRLGIKADSDLEEEEEKVDLRKEIFPLGHYINDREEMIEEMFSLIKGDKLRKMLPPILKDMPLDELKADCLIHLLGMSKKRIFSILEGRQIDSSSDSESHSDSSIKPNKKRRPIVKPIVIKQEGCSDISDNPEEVVLIDPDSCESVISNTKKKSKKGVKRTKHSVKLGTSTKIHKKKKVVKAEDVEHSTDKQEAVEGSDSENDVEAADPTEGKNLLEILELEMRARAIRALLHKDGPKDVGENDKKIVSEEKDAKTQSHSDSSVEDSDELENNKVTPAKNIRKRKSTNDDVIVVAPKLVTIDLTDEIDSRLKNETLQKGNDIAITENKQDKSAVNKNKPILDTKQEPEASKNDKTERPEDNTNESKSITLYDSKEDKTPNNKSKDPKSGLSSNKECAFEDGALDTSGISSNKECELEDGELNTKEDDHEDVVVVGDNNLIEIQPKDSEIAIKEIVDGNEDCNDKQSELIISESSVNDSELLKTVVISKSPDGSKLSDIGETVILSDDDSTLSELNCVTNKIRTDEKYGKIENLEVGTSTSTSEHTSTQLVGESGDFIKDTNAKKSWAQRWLDSKEVKKVVSTSKLCGSIRKRIKIAKLAKKQSLEVNQSNIKQEIAPSRQDIQGSVDEYQLLPKSLTVYNTESSRVGESNADQNEISSLNIPTIDSTLENANSKEQVQDVTSTDNMENSHVLEQSSDTYLNDNKGKLQNKQLPNAVIETNSCDQNKNESDTILIYQNLTLKTCDSSSRAVEQTHLEESDAILVQNENVTEINTVVDTTSKEARINSPRHSNSEEFVNLLNSEDISEKNVCNDKLQIKPVVNTSQTTKDKKIDDTVDLDQNGPETLEINITDEELEIDGIINDIIDPTKEDVVWSKNKIVEID